ncbi:hypothetical protein NSQ26_04770 [Bacillus sp. FSL W7-1360]
MNITRNQVSMLLDKVGCKTIVSANSIKVEEMPYENYHELRKENGKWLYGLVYAERTNSPYLDVEKEFVSENEATTYFLLDMLSYHYVNKKITSFEKQHPEFERGTSSFTVQELYKALQLAGIPKDTFCVDGFPKHTCIHLKKVNDAEYVLAILSNGKEVYSTIPLDLEWALSLAFLRTFLLHLFQTEVPKLLQSEGITETFTDKEMAIFSFGVK